MRFIATVIAVVLALLFAPSSGADTTPERAAAAICAARGRGASEDPKMTNNTTKTLKARCGPGDAGAARHDVRCGPSACRPVHHQIPSCHLKYLLDAQPGFRCLDRRGVQRGRA
jgi:uncharacterized low-complexity protein